MASGDILDFLTNNWSTLLGGQTPSVGPSIQNPVNPAANTMVGPGNPTGAPPIPAPTPQQNYNAAQAGLGVPTPPQGAFSGQPFSASGAVGPNPLTSGDPTTMASLNGGALPAPAPAPGANPPPMDQTLANMQPGANGTPQDPNQYLPPNSTSTMGGGPPPATVASVGGGQAGPPLAPPPAAPGGLSPALAAQLGAMQQRQQQRGGFLPTALASLGKGLSAVGGMPAGAPAGKAFAAGAGGALTGATEFQQKQQDDAFKERQQFFNETIASDNQSMKGQMFPLLMANTAARTGLLTAQQARQAANGGTNAWQVSDVGRLHLADQETDEWEKRELQRIKMMNDSGLDTTDMTKNFEANRAAQLKQNYQKYNVDPKTAKGASQQQPIDASQMSMDRMKSMPAGTWFSYTDKDTGKTVTTTRKADEFNTPQLQQQPQQAPQIPYAVQQEALTPPSAME